MSKPLWVIEVLMNEQGESGEYEPTVICGITRESARQQLKDVKYHRGFAPYKYRIAKYIKSSIEAERGIK